MTALRDKLRRPCRWMYLKVVRERGSAEYIARGWALGAAVGCIVPVGGQLLVAIPMAFLLRCSKIGATAGTFVTNNFTVFFIYPAQCYVGNQFIGGDLSMTAIRHALRELLEERSYGALFALGNDLLWSFFVGGVVFALAATPATYFFVRHLVRRFRDMRRLRRLKRHSETRGASSGGDRKGNGK